MVLIVGSICLMVLGIIIYLQQENVQEEVEFNEFNSQYVGKESTRSNSEFPNFAVDILR
jgi:hypothetical protein